MVIGNSSSGLLEVPSFHIPTINIGNRQQGRIKAKSVIDCKCEKIEIIQAVKRAEVMKTNVNMDLIVNPYEGKNTSKVILDVIKEYLNRKHSMVKIFYDIENA